MKIAITGGNGFIGRALVDSLLRQGHELTMISRRAEGEAPTGVKLLRGDLVTADCPIEQLLAGRELIYHCAAELHDESKMRSLHVDATQRLLAATLREARDSGRSIHWVQLSSVGVYGPPAEGPGRKRIVTEETATNPVGEYETTKLMADELVLEACRSGLMTYSIVRPSNVFGSGMPNQSLRALGEIVRKRLFFYIGNPGAVATYVHVDDVVDVLLRCGFDPRARDEIFNLSNDCPLDDLIAGMAAALGVAPPRLRLPETPVRFAVRLAEKIARIPLTQQRVDALVAKTRYPCAKLEAKLDYRPRVPVARAIGETLQAKSNSSVVG